MEQWLIHKGTTDQTGREYNAGDIVELKDGERPPEGASAERIGTRKIIATRKVTYEGVEYSSGDVIEIDWKKQVPAGFAKYQPIQLGTGKYVRKRKFKAVQNGYHDMPIKMIAGEEYELLDYYANREKTRRASNRFAPVGDPYNVPTKDALQEYKVIYRSNITGEKGGFKYVKGSLYVPPNGVDPKVFGIEEPDFIRLD